MFDIVTHLNEDVNDLRFSNFGIAERLDVERSDFQRFCGFRFTEAHVKGY